MNLTPDLEIVYLDPHDLTPYEGNARKHGDVDVQGIKDSIETDGFNDPIGIWGDNNLIVEGHGRQLAAIALGMEKVPCIRLDHLTDAQRRDYAIRHNRTAELSEWDEAKKQIELEALAMEGFDVGELFESQGEQEQAEIKEDEAPEPPEEPKTKIGDIYQLGQHRLICGDSTDPAVIDRLMDGVKADMVFTDPPYNVDYSNADRPKPSKTDLGKIKNDLMSEDEFIYFLGEVYKRLDENTKADSSFYIWYADKSTIAFYSALYETSIKFNQMLIWKKPMLLGRNRYQYAHEPCMFAIKGSPYFTEDRTKTTIWDFGGYDKSKNVHPTQKPLFLPSEAVQNSSKKGDIVLDLFGGSGSTLIACEQLNRKCYMAELDPKYCDVIIDRWEKFTGETAVLIDG